jgi:mannose-6-phosphate isomerase
MRMRVQARQIYVFAEAGRLGWDGPWRECVQHGLDFLIERGLRPDGLAAQTFTAEDGAVIDWGPDLYDQAFALFALGAGYAATGQARAKAAGLRMLEALGAQAHPHGGFREFDGPLLKANPQMHMFEAALAWTRADDDPRWRALAENLARLCSERLVDPHTDALHEFFVDGWRRAPGPAGDCTEPGHHFEWAWLLDQMNGGVAPGELTIRMTERAERLGVDRFRNVAVNAMDPQGVVLEAHARLWPQAERLKAALVMRREDPEFWTPRACEAHDALFRYMTVAPRGLWKDLLCADGTFRPDYAPASSLYHIACAVSELAQATGAARARW